jgi:5'-nucleotidase
MTKPIYVLVTFFLIACFIIIAPNTQGQEQRELTLMHTNSLYAHIQEYTPFGQPLQGGIPRLATSVQAIRAEHDNSLLVSSGRDVLGTTMFTQYGGVVMADVMSQVGYDIALVTAIDLGAGGTIDAFAAYQSVAAYPLVNANFDMSVTGIEIPANEILDVNGVKVGVFGLTSELSSGLTNLGELDVFDTDEVVEEQLAFFKEEGVDIVVLLSSLGVQRDAEVAEAHGGEDGIDVIVGNDSNTILGNAEDFPENSLQPIGDYPLVFGEETSPTLVVYGGRFGSYLGELNITFDADGVIEAWDGQLHFIDESITPDPDLQTYVDELVAGIDLASIVIGETNAALYGSFRDYSWQENPLANLYADAFLEASQSLGADIALVNAGAVWGTIDEGEISLADLTTVQPFFNWLVIMDVTGDQLKTALEHGVEQYGEAGAAVGRFLAVAGMTYTFDPSRDPGDRVTDVMIDGNPMESDAMYTIAVNDFMANGGDGYVMLREGSDIFNTGLAVTNLLQEYIEAHSPLEAPEIERITIMGE